MTIVLKRKDSGEIVRLPAFSVVFDVHRVYVFQDEKSSSFETFSDRYWELMEVCAK